MARSAASAAVNQRQISGCRPKREKRPIDAWKSRDDIATLSILSVGSIWNIGALDRRFNKTSSRCVLRFGCKILGKDLDVLIRRVLATFGEDFINAILRGACKANLQYYRDDLAFERFEGTKCEFVFCGLFCISGRLHTLGFFARDRLLADHSVQVCLAFAVVPQEFQDSGDILLEAATGITAHRRLGLPNFKDSVTYPPIRNVLSQQHSSADSSPHYGMPLCIQVQQKRAQT